MKEQFIKWKGTAERVERLGQIEEVLEEFGAMNVTLTLRQLYYQLVTKNIIANSQLEYRKLSDLLSKARLAGLVDWTAIEDRVRRPDMRSSWGNIQELVETAIHSYRRDRWEDQEYFVELWSEKDALSSILSPIVRRLHVTLMVNRGYSSQSAMYDSAERFKAADEAGKKLVLLYLGDLDPSGEDMVRDITDRFAMFGVEAIEIRKVGINPDQVRKFKLPPNPAKKSDPRSTAFTAEFGGNSYEVDAIPPKSLISLVESQIESFMDLDAYEAVKEQEEEEKEQLVKLAKKIRG